MVDTEVYQHLTIRNNCTNLVLLINSCAVYFISASAVSIIEIVLKISLSNADAKDRKFDVMMISLPLTLINPMPKYLLSQYIFV